MSVTPLKIIFMGTPEFATWALGALIDGPHKVVAVYSQPPRRQGRGMKLSTSPVQQLAEKYDVPVHTPMSLKKPEAQAEFATLNADIAVVAAYGLILPKAVLNAPRLGCVNIHASLLPRWRGAAPIQRAILAGDVQSGITFMQMNEGLDTGPILKTYPTLIQPDTTAPQLQTALAQIGAREINQVIEDSAQGRLMPLPQPEDGVTYAEKLSKEDSQVNWQKSASEIHRMVRALNPWPGVWTELYSKRVKIIAATLDETDDAIAQDCGEGKIYITTVQPEGGKAMPAKAFMQGRS